MLYVRSVVDWFLLALVNFEGFGLQRQVARNLVGHERQWHGVWRRIIISLCFDSIICG